MKIEPQYLIPFITMIPGIVIWGLLFRKMRVWRKIMDTFKDGLPFEKALEALKQGKSIRRKRSSYGLTKMTVSARGEEREKFCEFDMERKDKLREDPILSMKDIIASDWIIED